MNYFRPITLLLIIKLLILSITSHAQDRATATPLTAILTTPTPFVERSVATVTVTPTFTPTPLGDVLLEVRESAGSINVRTEPGPEADQLGSISSGTLYPVYRQFYSWYEIEFELSPNRRGWIYGELVDIVGDETQIEFIEDFNWATPQSSLSSSSTDEEGLSEEDVSSTPVTRQLDPPTIESPSLSATPDQAPLPTFTYPPDTRAQVNVQREIEGNPNPDTSTNRTSPLLPIILLGGAGVVGLLLDAVRR